jgi:hypothetical protein
VRLADIKVQRGDLPGALKSCHDSLAIRERLAKADPGNAGWQRDLSAAYDRIGDMLVCACNASATHRPEGVRGSRARTRHFACSTAARAHAGVQCRWLTGEHRLVDDWLPRRVSFIHGKYAICRQTPEVGAVCGKAARTVLCGGDQ